MAWKAELTKQVEKRGGNVVATVRFSNDDDSESFTQEIPASDLSPESLAEFCQTIVVMRESRDVSYAACASIPVGPIQLPRDA